MSVVYIGAGLFLLLGENIFNLGDTQRIGLGIILIIYSFFRFYNTFRKQRKRDSDDEEN